MQGTSDPWFGYKKRRERRHSRIWRDFKLIKDSSEIGDNLKLQVLVRTGQGLINENTFQQILKIGDLAHRLRCGPDVSQSEYAARHITEYEAHSCAKRDAHAENNTDQTFLRRQIYSFFLIKKRPLIPQGARRSISQALSERV